MSLDLIPLLSGAKDIVRLEITDDGEVIGHIDIDADGVSTIIRNLATIRAQMADVVPRDLDPGGNVLPDTTVNPRVVIGNEGPMSRLALVTFRHPGLGWVSFAFNEDNTRRVCMGLTLELQRMRSKGLHIPNGPGFIVPGRV